MASPLKGTGDSRICRGLKRLGDEPLRDETGPSQAGISHHSLRPIARVDGDAAAYLLGLNHPATVGDS